MKLETERLILRKPRSSDADDLVEGLNNLNITKNLSVVPYPYKKNDAVKHIKKTIESWKKREKTKYYFIIELKKEKKVIGAIILKDIDKFNGVCLTGSWINEKYWRKGYITEAKIAVNEFVFNDLKLRKLETDPFTTNKASNFVQKSLGYKYEGTRKQHHRCKATGKIHDDNLYGLLKEDWKKNLPKLKKHLKEKIKKLEK